MDIEVRLLLCHMTFTLSIGRLLSETPEYRVPAPWQGNQGAGWKERCEPGNGNRLTEMPPSRELPDLADIGGLRPKPARLRQAWGLGFTPDGYAELGLTYCGG